MRQTGYTVVWEAIRKDGFEMPKLKRRKEKEIYTMIFSMVREAIEKKKSLIFKIRDLPIGKRDLNPLIQKGILIYEYQKGEAVITMHPRYCTREVECSCGCKYSEAVYWRIGYRCPSCRKIMSGLYEKYIEALYGGKPPTEEELRREIEEGKQKRAEMYDRVFRSAEEKIGEVLRELGVGTEIKGFEEGIIQAMQLEDKTKTKQLEDKTGGENNNKEEKAEIIKVKRGMSDYINLLMKKRREIREGILDKVKKKHEEILSSAKNETKALIQEHYLNCDGILNLKKYGEDNLKSVENDPKMKLFASGISAQILIDVKRVCDELANIEGMVYLYENYYK